MKNEEKIKYLDFSGKTKSGADKTARIATILDSQGKAIMMQIVIQSTDISYLNEVLKFFREE